MSKRPVSSDLTVLIGHSLAPKKPRKTHQTLDIGITQKGTKEGAQGGRQKRVSYLLEGLNLPEDNLQPRQVGTNMDGELTMITRTPQKIQDTTGQFQGCCAEVFITAASEVMSETCCCHMP